METSLTGLSVLIVEDEALLQRKLAAHLEHWGAESTSARDLAGARRLIGSLGFDFVLLDVHLPDGQGTDLLRERAFPVATGVIVMTAQGAVEGAVEAIRLGALDYIVKPFDPAVLALVMGRARRARQAAREVEFRQAEEKEEDPLIFGDALQPLAAQLQRILEVDRRLQSRLPPVLITGETGTGKTSLARWLHRQGPRTGRAFIQVNCSALPETLAESELFGHERGAFTDARSARLGLFEAADGGTLFLDELPSLSLSVQAKVLTALEDLKIRRVGGTREIEVDVRIIGATSRDLRQAAAYGEFREDLRQRLDLFRVELPPLRERAGDVLDLAEKLLERLCRRHRLPLRRITAVGRQRLAAYPWPGNVRELAHVLERALVFEDGAELSFAQLIGRSDSGSVAWSDRAGDDWLRPGYRFPDEGFQLEDAINRLVQLALQQSDRNISQAARRLGVTRDFVRYRLFGDRRKRVDEEGSLGDDE